MKERLKRFYHAHPESKLLKGMLKIYRAVKNFLFNIVLGIVAVLRLAKWKFRSHDTKRAIRVCFVQQDPNCWNKSKALYQKMLADDRFQVRLLCVPDPFDADTESTYRYFRDNGYDAIDARAGVGPWSTTENRGQWVSLQDMQPDYVFYQQPYDSYLPPMYRSGAVSKYAKVCITPYGFTLTKELLQFIDRRFYRKVYRMYAVSGDEKVFNEGRFPISHKLGLRQTRCFGPLVFADFFGARGEASDSWEFSKNRFRVIWTPRWTTDEVLGGSNFFRYKDVLPEYARTHKNIDVLLRPHPMAFDNFVRTGEMTQDEVDSYIAKCNAMENCAIDTQKAYNATFWQSSVLVTDVSAIIVEYFVTGKPIIFCRTEKSGSTFLPVFEQLLSVCYIADNAQEVTEQLDRLAQGEDPLAPQRAEMIKKIFGAEPEQVPQKIIADIVSDYYKGER